MEGTRWDQLVASIVVGLLRIDTPKLAVVVTGMAVTVVGMALAVILILVRTQ